MKLSRTVSYALQASLLLAQADSTEPIPCSQLAQQGSMPERFLLQVLRNLVTHGILRSTRGVDGGYTLVRSADQVSLLELIEAIEGPFRTEPTVGEGLSPICQDRLREALEEVTTAARQKLAAVKLSDLLPRDADGAAKEVTQLANGKSHG